MNLLRTSPRRTTRLRTALLKEGRRLLVAVPAAILVLCLIGLYLTRGSMANLGFLNAPATTLVDQRPWQTIQALAPLAVSAEEQNFAQQAERLADHEVDQAFALALRQASTQPKAISPEAAALAEKIATLQQEIKADQARVQSLGGDPSKPADAAGASGSAATPANDDLEEARTQLQLDSDELADAQENYARATGDKRAAIQQELAAREAALKKSATAGDAKTAIVSAKSRGTLAARISAWLDQRSRYALVLQAQHQAEADAAELQKEHVAVEQQSNAAAAAASASLAQKGAEIPASTAPAPAARPASRAARLELLRTLSEEHSILDDRLDTQRQLALVYGKWAAQVQRQHGIVLHLMLRSFALIAFIILCAVLAISLVEILVNRASQDVAELRRVRTLRTIVDLAIEVVSLLMILLVVFGPPSQMPTILGLATAGVTVVFQDFILAFFGWFVLMGKHGIRVGDWVEINSVGGEVVEIGLFRTTLMETGNWTDKGHPTGRRVTFINNFAITGQFFNFSTVGQWMWDEIRVTIPAGEAAFNTVEAIRQRVIAETSHDAHLAEAEWSRTTTQQSLSQFTASPSVDLRPASGGIDVVVRYVTRAGDRFEMRNRIYQAMIDILHLKPEALPAPEAVTANQ